MKKNSMLIGLLLPLAAGAQQNYIISGSLSQLKEPAMVYLSYGRGEEEFQDSVEVKEGSFRFEGMVEQPTQAFLTLRRTKEHGRSNDYLPFFIENSDIRLVAKDSIKNAQVEGSVSDRENKELEASIWPLTRTIIRLQDEFSGKPKDEAYMRASDSVANLVTEIKNIRLNFAKTHPNSFIGLSVYNSYVVDKNFDPATQEPLFYQFSKELQASALGKQTREKIEQAKRRQVGIRATDFTQADLNDKLFTLSSLRGKYVLVDFWASWCVPCRAENPNLVKAYQDLKNRNFEVVGVSLDQNKQAWKMAVEKDGLPWIHVSDLKGWKNAVAVMYNIDAVPQNLLINPEGIIIAKNLRGEALTAKLQELIK